MSENSFKVPAKTPRPVKKDVRSDSVKAEAKAPARKTVKKTPAQKKQPASEKPDAPRKLKGSDLNFSKQELPALPSLANMTREERIRALSGGGEKKKPKTEEKTAGSERTEITRIKESVRKNSDGKVSAPVRVHEAPPAKRDSSVFLRLGFVFLVFLLIILIVILLKRRTVKPAEVIIASSKPQADLTVSITSGMGASQVSRLLPEEERESFLSFLSENNLASSIRTGEFSFPSGTGGEEIALEITRRETSRNFTVYAGYTVSDIDQALSVRGLATPGEFIGKAEEYASSHGLSFTEGYFLAGSYAFTDTGTLLDEMHEALLDLLRANADAVMESGLSVDDIVKIASIINRESQDSAQLRTIAAIVLNRIRLAMPIGVDATTRYETGNWKDPIPQSTYEKDTPYNTRRKAGLPPSGIGCPGADAVLAVLYPDKTDHLYYLHDEEGKLYTSASYEDHLSTYEKVHQI